MERISTDTVFSPKWFEYLKFLGVVSAIGAALVLGPMVAMVTVSLLVTAFGWLVGALSV